jgi:hypothetical protein
MLRPRRQATLPRLRRRAGHQQNPSPVVAVHSVRRHVVTMARAALVSTVRVRARVTAAFRNGSKRNERNHPCNHQLKKGYSLYAISPYLLVGTTRFELATSRTPSERRNRSPHITATHYVASAETAKSVMSDKPRCVGNNFTIRLHSSILGSCFANPARVTTRSISRRSSVR